KPASCEMECAGADSGAKMLGTKVGSVRSAAQRACGATKSIAIQNIHGGMKLSSASSVQDFTDVWDDVSLVRRAAGVASRSPVPSHVLDRHFRIRFHRKATPLGVLIISHRSASSRRPQ